MYSTKLEDTDVPELSAFKVILLLNLLNRVTQMDGADQEKSLVNPSKKNILHVLSGEWSSDAITRALDSIDEKQIVLKGRMKYMRFLHRLCLWKKSRRQRTSCI